jgi:hypothetical protein
VAEVGSLFAQPRKSWRRFASPLAAALLGFALVPLSVIMLGQEQAFPQQVRPTEYQVKAAYLYNFGKFVRPAATPVSTSSSFVICVLGRDPFGSVLDSTVAGQSLDSRTIAVQRMASLSAGARCNVLFISSTEEGRLSADLAAAQRLGILTVSDIPNFAQKGGVIGFVMQGDRVRFEVNRRAAEQSHVLLSSELLKVATRVLGENPGS